MCALKMCVSKRVGFGQRAIALQEMYALLTHLLSISRSLPSSSLRSSILSEGCGFRQACSSYIIRSPMYGHVSISLPATGLTRTPFYFQLLPLIDWWFQNAAGM